MYVELIHMSGKNSVNMLLAYVTICPINWLDTFEAMATPLIFLINISYLSLIFIFLNGCLIYYIYTDTLPPANERKPLFYISKVIFISPPYNFANSGIKDSFTKSISMSILSLVIPLKIMLIPFLLYSPKNISGSKKYVIDLTVPQSK